MSLPGAVGSQDPARSFIPEIWSGRIVAALLKETVMEAITNNYYKGEVQKWGDKVHIDFEPVPNVFDYHRQQKLKYENIEAPETILHIDSGHYFAAEVEDVLFYQSRNGQQRLNRWTENGGRGIAIAIDRRILNETPVDADTVNKGLTAGKETASINLGATGAPVGLTAANIIQKITDTRQVLNEQNAPKNNRWIVLPEWAYTLLLNSDLKNASFSADGGSTLRNGRAIEDLIAGFGIYSTNSYLSVVDGAFTAWSIIFGQTDAITFAKQIEKTETLRSQETFADLVRSLCVYGFKVIQPKSLGVLYAYQA